MAVETFEGGEKGGMDFVGLQEQRPRAFQELSPHRPELSLFQVLVEHFEQGAGAPVLAIADQGTRNTDKVVQIVGGLTEASEPFALDRVEVSLG